MFGNRRTPTEKKNKNFKLEYQIKTQGRKIYEDK